MQFTLGLFWCLRWKPVCKQMRFCKLDVVILLSRLTFKCLMYRMTPHLSHLVHRPLLRSTGLLALASPPSCAMAGFTVMGPFTNLLSFSALQTTLGCLILKPKGPAGQHTCKWLKRAVLSYSKASGLIGSWSGYSSYLHVWTCCLQNAPSLAADVLQLLHQLIWRDVQALYACSSWL